MHLSVAKIEKRRRSSTDLFEKNGDKSRQTRPRGLVRGQAVEPGALRERSEEDPSHPRVNSFTAGVTVVNWSRLDSVSSQHRERL